MNGVDSQGPRCKSCTKGGVSERPWAAGCVRGPVVGSSPGRRTEVVHKRGAVTPSVHLGVPKSLAVTPGRGKGLRATTWLEEGVWDRTLGDLVVKG